MKKSDNKSKTQNEARSKELRRLIRESKEKGDWKKASDKALELAQHYRFHGEREEAFHEFEKVLEIAKKANEPTDKILALRAIAEIHAENGDYLLCKQALNNFEEFVKNDPTEYQLMLAVAAYCMYKLSGLDEDNEQPILEALQYATKSLEYIETKDMDRRKMLEGDNVPIRHFNCHRQLAQIASLLDNKEEGEKHLKLAFNRVTGKENKYELMRIQVEFPWREEKGKLAEELSAFANESMKSKKVEADTILALTYFEREDIKRGENVLLRCYESINTKASSVPQEDKEKHSEALVFAYKVSTRIVRLRKCEEDGDQKGRFRQCDKLGDLYDSAGFKKAALRYYQKTRTLAETDKAKISALISCAETSADLKLYREAADYFDSVRQIENRMGKDISDTLARHFEMRLLAKVFTTDSDVNMEVDTLERHIKNPRSLKTVYETVAKYYENKGKNEEADRFKKLATGLMVPKKEEIEDEESVKENGDSDWDDTTILNQQHAKAREYQKKRNLLKAAGKVNKNAESKIIELAREGTLEEVKFLVEQGHDVNSTDPVGWTPLSEAVAANNFDIAMYLLAKGANPNSKSKEGFTDSDFDGGITPLMEACTNGHHKIAMRLLNHKQANDMVVTTNKNGWSPSDFMHHYIKEAVRGQESEGEFQQHLTACREVLEKIRKLQRNQAYPMRVGDPPLPAPKNGDTAKFAAEKERSRRAARKERKRGAVDEYKGGLLGVGSKSSLAEKGNRKSERKEEDLFDASDDEPLIRPTSSTKKSRVVVVSSDSEEEKEKEKRNKHARKSKSEDLDDPTYGLNDLEELPSFSHLRTSVGGGSSQPKRLSGVALLMQKKGKKRSTEREDENGVSIVPDDYEDNVETVVKRRRKDSEGSQSESADHRLNPPRHSVNNSFRDQFDFDLGVGGASAGVSPANISRAESHTSLSSASALVPSIFVKFIIVRAGVEREESFLSKAQSDLTIADLPKKVPKLKEALDGASADYVLKGDVLDALLTVQDVSELAAMKGQSMIEIECRVKKTIRAEFMMNCDSSDRDSALSDALHTLETSRAPSLVISNGSKYKEKTREALWQVIEGFAREKTGEDAKWRVERVEVENFDDVPASALRALIKLRPRETFSLRSCGIDDHKLEEMTEELDATENWRLAKVDLSLNDLIRSSEMLSKMISKFKGVHSVILHGLSGIDDGGDLMKTLGGLSLISLTLNENPWLDDSCMQEMMKGDGIGRLSTIQVSRTAIRTMNWMDGMKGIKSMSMAENNITASGWERVAEYIRSSATALHTLDMRGTAARAVILESLASRCPTAPMLRVTLTKCSLITPSEMCRALSPLVVEDGKRVNLEISIEAEKVEDVRSVSLPIASRVLKTTTTL